MAVLGLASPANGSELLAAVGDDCGFTFRKSQDLGTSPQTPWMNPIWTSTTDVGEYISLFLLILPILLIPLSCLRCLCCIIGPLTREIHPPKKDYAGNEPDHVVRVGNSQGAPQVAVSEDGGVTWSAHPGADDTTNSGTLAYSADADTIVWSSGSAGVLRSQNQGAFAAVGSLPSGAIVAADRRNNTVFYAASGASFYRSTDTGATFAKVASAFGGNGSSKVTAVKAIAAHPVVAGEVWVATDGGLFRSTDYGATFSAASGSIADAIKVSLGKGDGSAWNVYVFGTGPAGTKLYASADEGATWVDIQGEQGFGSLSANRLVGSGNVAGQVYVGTNGRGVFYAQVSLSAAAAAAAN
ncbi:hypothetical protein VTG60DRAFT_111 [Thermothelomyces hinnuleus]